MKKISKWMIFIIVLIVLTLITTIKSGISYSKDSKEYGKKIVTVGTKTAYPSDRTFGNGSLDTCQNAVNYVGNLIQTGSSIIYIILLVIIFCILYHYAPLKM
jgi:hypothetical protein